jgi:hypothetical protein
MSIQKFEGLMSREESGCTIVINETMQAITDFTILAVYAYLLTKPNSWVINPKELIRHFNSSKDRIYKALNGLIDLNLLRRIEHRQNGKFVGCEYKLYLKPHINTESSPCPYLPDAVKPDTENKDTYKTKKDLENKESNITNSDNYSKTKKQDELLEEIKEVYNEEMISMPKSKRLSDDVKRHLRKMILNWPEYEKNGNKFTIESFRNYLKYIKENPNLKFFTEAYTTKDGNKKRNNLKTITSDKVITKIINGEYSEN